VRRADVGLDRVDAEIQLAGDLLTVGTESVDGLVWDLDQAFGKVRTLLQKEFS
jgi:hypothetical protein